MARNLFVLGALVFISALVAQGAQDKGKPSKEAAVQVLRDGAAALEAKDYDKAATFFHIPPDVKLDVKKELSQAIDRQEISKKGVEILTAKGQWGPFADLFPKNAAARAKRMKVPLEACYGLRLDPAEAGFYWNGTQFKIFRMDDIGKLEKD